MKVYQIQGQANLRKKILIITDAWDPQVNGVVVTLTKTIDWLRSYGYEVTIIEPHQL